jgi:sporulation protein YlmC with PRC-barrel domain
MGWSVKQTLMGKSVYNDADEEVGVVEDLIISPNMDVSYVIVGAGGFIGIGRHDVAIPVTQIQTRAGKLVMASATTESIKQMPEFVYATDTTERDVFIAAAEKDIAKGRAAVADLRKQSGSAATGAREKIDLQIVALQGDLTSAEAKLTEMKRATADRWTDYKAGVSAAVARLRKSIG